MEVQYVEDLAFVDGYKFRKDKKSSYFLSSAKINGSRLRLHRYMWEKYNGSILPGYEVHHKDENKLNNEIDNLVLLSKKKHLEWHSENIPEELRDKWRNNLAETARPKAVEWHKSKEGRAWHSEHAKESAENAKIETYSCINCAKKYKAKKFGRGKKFCSPTCQTAFRVKSGVDNIRKECVICGSAFMINKYRKTVTCSRVCSAKLARINRK